MRGSVINRVVRAAGGNIDIHVISNAEDATEPDDLRSPRRLRLAPLSRRRQEVAFGLTILGLPLLTFTLLIVLLGARLQNAVLLCYLLFVVAIATIGGAFPAPWRRSADSCC